jgi:hypothetical protein
MTSVDRVQVAGWLLMVATVAGVLWAALGTRVGAGDTPRATVVAGDAR